MTILTASDAHIRQAADSLRNGGLVAFPTETVYGLGANACDEHAVANIYAAKNRPQFNPLISHYASSEAVFVDIDSNPTAPILASHFWPGPMTLVLDRPTDCHISTLASAGQNSVAVRVPAHRIALKLLSACGFPVVAPSANPSGKISPSCAEHVARAMADKIDIILDGGWCERGLESTVIDCRPDSPVLLRPGPLTTEQLAEQTGIDVTLEPNTAKTKTLVSPGQIESHYAPDAAVRLNATDRHNGEVYIGFGPSSRGLVPDFNLSESADLVEAATNLFAVLHEADALNTGAIAIAPIPMAGLGLAINDRIARAAAPRPSGPAEIDT